MDLDLSLLPQAAAQMRGALSSLYFAAARLAPSAAREQDPELDAKAALVDQSYYRLIRLVNNLTAARYLSEEPLPLQDRDIVEFVADIFAKAASLAPLRGLETRLVCAADSHICAFCPDALEQLLYQLLSNAFKFTPAGGLITVELRLSGGRVFLSVEDTGPGIDPERLETLFDSYHQAEQPAPPPQGLGLGLALCRGIAQGHGGVITAESHQGKGTRVTFSMPDRVSGTALSDLRFDYGGGFNHALMALSESMPPEAFKIRNH
ncbi:sensor histidine kinase KdpD [uncultured Oscillibacter sp.]|uniref:sensor histidine kinase n=1 Tax=uncultured Oscillibacter sp. TaxID=876091 RepID=UPI0021721091|nr:ATP-binding protein [uncultured Oscillibacter sp.]MCI9011671.1 sensor histidine kinase [Oscillibacter sp.]